MLPSSTNILEAFPNKGLDFWKTNTNPEDIRRAQEKGKSQGTKLHHCIDLGIMGETITQAGLSDQHIEKLGLSDRKLINYLKEPLTERESQALNGVENFSKTFEPVTIANEIIVVSLKHGYAGTCDWVGYLKDKKTGKHTLWVLDWKISKTVSRSNELQAVSYKQAIQEMHPLKKALSKAKIGTVYFGMNKCNFRLSEVTDEENAFKLFLATKELWGDVNKTTPELDTKPQESFAFNMRNPMKGKLLKL